MASPYPTIRRRKDVYTVDLADQFTQPQKQPQKLVKRGVVGSTGSLPRVPRRHTHEPPTPADPLGLDLAPSAAAMMPSSLLGNGRAVFLQGLRSHNKTLLSEQEAKSCQMALKYRVSLSEAKRIMKEFQSAKRNPAGGLDHKEFIKVMCRIFDVDAVDDHVVKGAYQATKPDKIIDIELFFNWYVQNMFTNVNSLNCSKDKKDSEKLVYEIARKHCVSTLVVDKVKVKFDYYDTNGSGHIDFQEFNQMFCSILKVKSVDELNPERIRRFWKEIDQNGDQGVDFAEFAAWYLKYFNVEAEGDDFQLDGPLRAFYDSYDPRVQRHNVMEKTNSINSTKSIN